MTNWTVWVGGSEVNSYHLTEQEATNIAKEWQDKGYTDVEKSNVKN